MIDLPDIELLEPPTMMTEHGVVGVIIRCIRQEANERQPMSYSFGVEVGRESTCKELLLPVEFLLRDELTSDSELDVELKEVVAQRRGHGDYLLVARVYF